MAGIEMTKKFLRDLCKTDKLYTTPYINDRLYLHCKGFRKIENLEEYTGLKSLWLEGNGLMKIEGLESCVLIRSLFLHENCIDKIEGLDTLVELDSINLSKNYITKIENLQNNVNISTLILSNNNLQTYEDIEHVLLLQKLQTLDIQQNKITDIRVVDIFASIPDLRVLYLQGNPVVKDIKHYRKTIVSRCKALKYLDDRPVFDDERRRVSAWARVMEATNGADLEGALEAERQEILLIKREKDEADERNHQMFAEMMREGRAVQLQR